MRVKICGITRPEDAVFAEKEGADAIGVVVCSEGSKRSVPLSRAREIFGSVGPFVTTVAVTHTQSESELRDILSICPDAIQIFHPFLLMPDAGVRVIRVIGSGDPVPGNCDAVIIDESHGSGKMFDAMLARNAVKESNVRVILAGGLNPENVGAAIRQVRPYAVDVATGVEVSPGIKDPVKVRAFIAACRGY